VACDAALLDLVEERAEALAEGRDLEDVVVRSVVAKAEVVGADEREEGRRVVLNAGHTAGHALETAAAGALRHGEAVAIGLVAELRYAVGIGVCLDPDLPDRVERLLVRLGLPVRAAVDGAALAALRLDKKGRGDKIQIAFPVRAGTSTVLELPRGEARAILQLTEEPRG
jgi:3-dehydroquinate synthetase